MQASFAERIESSNPRRSQPLETIPDVSSLRDFPSMPSTPPKQSAPVSIPAAQTIANVVSASPRVVTGFAVGATSEVSAFPLDI
jgi:inosine-uridine nucleoside N-ribohydrolase